MSILSYIALSCCLFVLSVGLVTTWFDRGFKADARRSRSRRRARAGGRRTSDHPIVSR